MAGDDFFYSVGAPARYTCRGEQRREYVLRDAEHGIYEAGIHINVGAHWRVALSALLYEWNAQLLHLLQQVEILGVALYLGHVPGVLLQQHGSGIRHGIYRVAKSVQLTGAVARLPVQHFIEIVLYGAIVMWVYVFLYVAEHLHHLSVCAAVKRSLQRTHCSRYGAVGICAA